MLSLANTGAVLGLVNRPGNRPSHEGAAAEVDRAPAVCFKGGFRSALLRGDTDFSQTEHLDRWDADGRVTFVFGYEAAPNLKGLAEDVPASAWQALQRPPRASRQILGDGLEVGGRLVAEDEGDAAVGVPAVEVLRLRAVGVAAEQRRAEAAPEADGQGLVHLPGGALV